MKKQLTVLFLSEDLHGGSTVVGGKAGWGGGILRLVGEGAGPKIFARPQTFSAWFHDDGTRSVIDNSLTDKRH